MKYSYEELAGMIDHSLLQPTMTDAELRQVVADNYGITDLTDAEIVSIRNPSPSGMDYTLGPMLSARSIIGWTTTGHTGEDVTLYSFGPQRPVGLFENTDMAIVMASALGLDLSKTSGRLFMEATSAFAAVGATVTIDSTDPNNKVLVVEKVGHSTMYMPLSR